MKKRATRKPDERSTHGLSREVLNAISVGYLSDPFAVLGQHPTGKKGFRICTFQPHASSVRVLPKGGKKTSAEKIHDSGIWAITFPTRTQPFEYLLEITPFEGEPYKTADAYQFEPQLSDFDLQLWGEGTHLHAWRFMGAHTRSVNGIDGTHFVVSAPSANRVSVIGSFNDWDGRRHPMRKYHEQGLWEIFIPLVGHGDVYKFEILTAEGGPSLKKADPFGVFAEFRPGTASIIHNSAYQWADKDWLKSRKETNHHESPISIYEVHLGSWRRDPSEPDRFLSYRELIQELVPYVSEMGYTHVEFMPVAEHPYDPSWGYQITGYFAPTSRFGTPDDFRALVDAFHRQGIGVILDWVPAHFTKDDHGLRRFDGTALYEHEDPRKGEHKDWGTLIFNYGRTEVQNFLLSNAIYWIEEFHIDGLRVDAVASMLYLDYSREEGEWIPNHHGGRENLDAIHFLQRFNTVVHQYHPGVLTFAEESTSWQGVSRPVHHGGLGFDFKWNMGWMNDTLQYIEKDPIYRKYHQNELTFSMIYAFTENFMLPLSHDEVVHMKQSMVGKMPGDDWQKFANLRLLYTYMMAHPGKKLLFMGGEIAQWSEWTQKHSLDWHLLQWEPHKGVQNLVHDLNHLYAQNPALHQQDHSWEGFQWIDMSDADNSLISFIRRGRSPEAYMICIFNFTPTVHHEYRFGVPEAREYEVILNSDSSFYSGSNVGVQRVHASQESWHHQPAHISITVPPLTGLILKPC